MKTTSVDWWLRKMAYATRPSSALDRRPVLAMSTIRPLCHYRTAEGILRYPSVLNKIWFFGSASNDKNGVIHSLLTDQHDKVLVDFYPSGNGKLEPARGYHKPLSPGSTSEWLLPILHVETLKDFYLSYFENL